MGLQYDNVQLGDTSSSEDREEEMGLEDHVVQEVNS